MPNQKNTSRDPQPIVNSMLWITDPWETLAHYNDTTLRLMHEAMKLGIPTYWSAPDFIFTVNFTSTSSPETHASKNGLIKVIECKGDKWFETKPIEMPITNFQQIHYRVDPPVDFNYISVIDKLLQLGAREEQILNPPQLLKFQSEKVPPIALSALIPKMISITDEQTANAAVRLFEKETSAVLKPLNTAQSIGVKKIDLPDDADAFFSLLKEETENFTHPMVLQEYLPLIDDGEIRMWFVNGDLLSSLKKYPKKGDFRVLIDEGSAVKRYELNTEEKARAGLVGSVLKQQKAAMAAIDFIGDKISDYNITSPGLLVQMEAVYDGHNFAKTILEKLLTRNE